MYRTVARVTRFGDAAVVRLHREALPASHRSRVRVRVTHASLGATDVLARRGGYLLQPLPGFAPGYDFVGVLETVDAAATRRGLTAGTRVAGVLPRMGAHATHVWVPSRHLVAVPDGLDSATAAALPLDVVTARRALDLLRLPDRSPVLVQGVTGAVGSLVAHHAVRAGHEVYGTASAATAHLAEARGVRALDYRDPAWPDRVRASGGVAGCVDHTGARDLRRLVTPGGRIVRIAFTGRAGSERRDTALGSVGAVLHRAGRPAERVCSVPGFVARAPGATRRLLAAELDLAVTGELPLPSPTVLPFAEVGAAHRAAERTVPGEKIVLDLQPPSPLH